MRSKATIILGGYGGIGSEVCRTLSEAGRRPIAIGRDREQLQQLASVIDVDFREADGSDFRQIDDAIGELSEQYEISAIVNCIGSLLLKPAHLTSAEDWLEVVTKNLTTSFAAVRAAGKYMKDRGGSVVLMSSAAGRFGLANHDAIAAAKAGVIGLTLSSAATYARHGIRVNAIAPGLIRTPLTRRIWSNDRSAAASTAMHALGRLGEPQDVASLIEWLTRPGNDWITGQVFGVDGGLASVQPKI